MALRATPAALLKPSRGLLAGNPYYHMPRNVTKTVMSENWRFTGRLGMLSHREQLEYTYRNHSYGNFAVWWQGHFDAIVNTMMCTLSVVFAVMVVLSLYGQRFGLHGPEFNALFRLVMGGFTTGTALRPVWFEEEARQKKLGLFAED